MAASSARCLAWYSRSMMAHSYLDSFRPKNSARPSSIQPAVLLTRSHSRALPGRTVATRLLNMERLPSCARGAKAAVSRERGARPEEAAGGRTPPSSAPLGVSWELLTLPGESVAAASYIAPQACGLNAAAEVVMVDGLSLSRTDGAVTLLCSWATGARRGARGGLEGAAGVFVGRQGFPRMRVRGECDAWTLGAASRCSKLRSACVPQRT
mmetsp:Transcript_39213/g.99335  ORF Transcript_39213/g.99335 Transcript_39213/m.99335 type:complete len:211 (-) Transcript_39213:47-679(-)